MAWRGSRRAVLSLRKKAFLTAFLSCQGKEKLDPSLPISPPHHRLRKDLVGLLENETDEDDNGLEAVKMAEKAVKAVKMAEDLKSKVEEELIRLKQLDVIESRLTEVSSRLSNIEETVTRIYNDMSDLKDKHSELERR